MCHIMSDDDDDGVEPQIEDVNEYSFEDGEEEPVCFSILPFQFGEDDKNADFFRKNVFLKGFADKSLRVYKEVVAWKIRFDSELPYIYVLSIEHKWIKLLKPRKCYGEDFVRSILITVQMLHFVQRWGQRRSLNHLWNHLDEVFGKYNPKPAADDLMKHQTLIKLFVEKDQTLMKSEILRRLIENGFERTKKALGLEAQFTVSSRRHVRKNGDNNYGNKDDSGDDCDDGDGSSDDGDDSSDDDDESSNDDGTDQICAICDDGGKLLICEGPCKRSFHPREKDGRESKCETLGYTSAEVKSIGTYICANCQNKQHQCFRCGELDPSDGPNAKVFQCNRASCGYFYHPKCIAPLLDPNATDEACELERRIMAGMSFPCPIHWCFKCGRMEDKTQRALQLAVCRRCPRAYHTECLPRELSLRAKDKDGNTRAWKLSKTIFIYCLDHEIDKDTSAASRNIKFPATPECTKTKELGNSKGRITDRRRKNTDQSTKPTKTKELDNSKGRMTGKRRKNTDQSTKPTKTKELDNSKGRMTGKRRKNTDQSTKPTKTKELDNSKGRMTGKRRKNTDQSTKPTELSNGCGAESEQADNVGAKSTSPQIVVEPICAAKLLKGDPQIEQSIIGVAASQNGSETMEGHEKQFGISSCVASTETEKRVTCLAATPYDGTSTNGMSDCSVQDTPVDNDVELDNVTCRITDDKYANGREKTQEDYSRKETAHCKDSIENQGQNDVLELDNLWVEIQADGSSLQPENKRDKEWQENAYGLGSASGMEKETSSSRENPRSERGIVPMNDSTIIYYSKGGMTVDNVDDHSSEGSYSCQVERSHSKCNDGLVAIDQDTSSDRSKKRSQPVEKASDLDKNKKHNLREDGRDAHYEDKRTERNTADTSRHKCRDKTQSDRRQEEPVGRSTRSRSREHSPERQRMECGDSYPGSSNRQRCESPNSVNSSRSGGDDRRQLSPCLSSFPSPESGGDHSHLVVTSGRRNPPYRLAGGYGEGSRSSRPVTDKYAPRLDRTNYQPRSQSDLQVSCPVIDWYAPRLESTNYQPRGQSDLQVSWPIIDWYAPRLESTNYQPRGQSDLHFSWPVTDCYAPHLESTNYQPRGQSDLLQYMPLLLQQLHNRNHV